MRVRTTILLLLLLAGAAFLAGLFAMRRLGEQQFAAAVAERQKVWRDSLSGNLERDGRPLQKFVNQHSWIQTKVSGESRGELLTSTELDAADVAQKAWDESMWSNLIDFDANAVWIYRKDGSLFYNLANTENAKLAALPAGIGPIADLFTRTEPLHFYFFLDDAGPDSLKRRVVEVRGSPIYPHDNQELPVLGYFLAGRIWGGEMLRELPLLSGDDEPVLLPADQELPPEASASTMCLVQDLRDWKDSNIARFVVTNRSRDLSTIEARGGRLFWMLIVGTLGLFTVLFAVLGRSIVRPLSLILDALHREDVQRLEPLRGQKAEFGDLARLILDFFEQQLQLTREMLERIGTEKALRESEEMLRHSQKMEAVGRLAGGVAHDFNNLLTAIIGYAVLLRQRFAHDPAACQPAELIHQAGEQAAGLTRQLLAFSRKQLLQPKIIDLNAIVANLERLLQRIIGEHIEIRTALEASPACVNADPGQIEQVIVNLGVNARDAMPRGGRLTIRTAHLEISAGQAVDELPPGAYLALEVTDTGEGMDEQTQARIFEPFFTTKGPGKGTGLGLATVYGIVRQSHGGIVVESERGRGSTFRVLLPRVDAPAEALAVAATVAPRSGGAETILIVEDEEIVRELVCEILREHGYRVLATAHGAEAVRMAREENGRIDLLISDVVMPGMNGGEVARRVREAATRARVLFVSGYSENDMADQGLEALAFQVLQKPFTPAALATKVREVLDFKDQR